jgi:hypothetical protein
MGLVFVSCIMDLDRQRLRTVDAGDEDVVETPVEQDLEQDAEPDAEEAVCGNGVCEEAAGETCLICPLDCGACECETDADCLSDEVCGDGKCVRTCTTDADCGPGGMCLLGYCLDRLATLCGNDEDDDGDGLVDCRDPDCFSNGCYADCMQEDDNASCSDGVDNDGSGASDCDDDNCAYGPNVTVCPCGFGSERECSNDHCTNGADDDGDGHVDCGDDDCRLSAHVTACDSENTDALCSDGEDNDDNGFADCNDYLCLRSVWVSVCCEPGGG